MHTAITYIGKNSGYVAKFKNKIYDFEWQKSRGIGNLLDEVELKHAVRLANRRDRKGKKIFRLE